ncbi:MAG: hypothetical protein ACFB4I_01760 [Cyanophyceae cyanobacterium]
MEKTGKELFEFLVGNWKTTNEYGTSLICLSENETFETSMTTDGAVMRVAKAVTDLMGFRFQGRWRVSNNLVIIELDNSSAGMLAPLLAVRKAFYGDISRQSVKIMATNRVALKNLESGQEYIYERI